MTPASSADDDLIPPVEARTVYRTMAAALLLAGLPALLGVVELGGTQYPSAVASVRLLLVALAALVGAAGLAMKPKLPAAWLLAAAVAVACMFGLPAHWDSIRLVLRVLAGLATVGGALAAAPANGRYAVISAAALFHIGGLLVATTWPDPSPWLTNQLAGRVYMPYFRFMYLTNAYHFYSPEPGPANHLYALIRYEVEGNPKPVFEWLDIPDRQRHFKDPLGMTYYRRLSLTELVSQSAPASITPWNIAKLKAREQRDKATIVSEAGTVTIPLKPEVDPIDQQYRVAYTQLRGQTLPSYAKHLAKEHDGPGRRVVSVKLFRVEHRVIPAQYFLDKRNEQGKVVEPGGSPYHPLTYRPYYLGEYDPAGELVNPLDPMLYWLVPIVPKVPLSDADNDYIDYLSDFAGAKFPWPSTARARP